MHSGIGVPLRMFQRVGAEEASRGKNQAKAETQPHARFPRCGWTRPRGKQSQPGDSSVGFWILRQHSPHVKPLLCVWQGGTGSAVGRVRFLYLVE